MTEYGPSWWTAWGPEQQGLNLTKPQPAKWQTSVSTSAIFQLELQLKEQRTCKAESKEVLQLFVSFAIRLWPGQGNRANVADQATTIYR